jgi:hypothetical protein
MIRVAGVNEGREFQLDDVGHSVLSRELGPITSVLDKVREFWGQVGSDAPVKRSERVRISDEILRIWDKYLLPFEAGMAGNADNSELFDAYMHSALLYVARGQGDDAAMACVSFRKAADRIAAMGNASAAAVVAEFATDLRARSKGVDVSGMNPDNVKLWRSDHNFAAASFWLAAIGRLIDSDHRDGGATVAYGRGVMRAQAAGDPSVLESLFKFGSSSTLVADGHWNFCRAALARACRMTQKGYKKGPADWMTLATYIESAGIYFGTYEAENPIIAELAALDSLAKGEAARLESQ